MHMMNDMNDDLDIFGPRGWPNDPSLLLVAAHVRLKVGECDSPEGSRDDRHSVY